jgi:enoyl-CoA hydratase/carnithine racemase
VSRMTCEFAEVRTEGRVMIVTLNRPQARNALHPAANFELGRVFDAFDADPALWVAVITGAGDKAFCAGADLKQARVLVEDATPSTGFAGMTSRFSRAKPVIAAVNGFAMGGGFELALSCDLIIAAETAKFGLTEPRVGLAALGGGIQRVVRELGPKRAHALLLTGRHVTAHEGLALGFVNEVVPEGQALAAALRWAEEILACSPASIRATKAVADSLEGRSVEASMATMFDLPAVKALFESPDAIEGPRAFAERRSPRWTNP